MIEEWREIEGFNGKFLVSNTGKVKTDTGKNVSIYLHRGTKNHIAYRVNLNDKKFYVHRLVAAAFLENPENKKYVDHIDQNSLNNCVENLRYATNSENHGNKKKNAGKSQYKGVSKLNSKWRAKLKTQTLGIFLCEHAAAQTYNRHAQKHFGEFACLNEVSACDCEECRIK